MKKITFLLTFLFIVSGTYLQAQVTPSPGTMEFGTATAVLADATNPSIDQSINALLNGFDASMTTSTNARLIAFAKSGNGFGTDQTAGGGEAALAFGGDFNGTTNSSTLTTDSGNEIGITSFDFAYERGANPPVVLTFTASGKKMA